MAPTHLTDNDMGGVGCKAARRGLDRKGKELIRRLESTRMVLDLAHASPTGVRRRRCDGQAPRGGVAHRCCWHVRERTEPERRSTTSGRDNRWSRRHRLLGNRDVWHGCRAIARAIRHAVNVMGIDHVGPWLRLRRRRRRTLRHDRAGRGHRRTYRRRVQRRRDRRVMGGNVIRLLLATLP